MILYTREDRKAYAIFAQTLEQILSERAYMDRPNRPLHLTGAG